MDSAGCHSIRPNSDCFYDEFGGAGLSEGVEPMGFALVCVVCLLAGVIVGWKIPVRSDGKEDGGIVPPKSLRRHAAIRH